MLGSKAGLDQRVIFVNAVICVRFGNVFKPSVKLLDDKSVRGQLKAWTSEIVANVDMASRDMVAFMITLLGKGSVFAL